MPAKPKTVRVLCVGDIIGKIGRRGLAAVLPGWRTEHQIDCVIANVENLAHGKGVTQKTWDEVAAAGVDVGTGGNHSFKKEAFADLCATGAPLLRPANYDASLPGSGTRVVSTPAGPLLVINLAGQMFFGDNPPHENPFTALDALLAANAGQARMIVVDFHAEVTSEKPALGLYADSRVSAVVGTHSHVPTADCTILPGGTGYVTDLGMVGLKDSVGGGIPGPLVSAFAAGEHGLFDIPDDGVCTVQAVLLTLDPESGQCLDIHRLDATVTV